MEPLFKGIKHHAKVYLAVVLILLVQFGFLLPFINDKRYILLFLFETFVLLCVSLYGKSRLLRLFMLLPLLIEAAQYASIYSTGRYIIPLTLLNMGNTHVIGNQLYVVSALFILYILLGYINIFLLSKIHIFSKKRALVAVLAYLTVMSIFAAVYNGQEARKKYPFPIENLACISYNVMKVLLSTSSDEHAKFFEKKFIPGNFKNKISANSYKNYNILTIFLEGTSTAVLSESLTPCFKKLQKEGINFINYYNHTASTFRGIRGQLISGYSLKGILHYNRDSIWFGELANKIKGNMGAAPVIESLPLILEKHGYTTVFISPHNKNDRLAPVMKRVGFQQVFTAENFGEEFSHYLSDKQSYQFLWQELMELKGSHKPFFLCLYQFGTHHGQDSPDKKYGDGQNSYLNKFHNADFWLGNFVDKFLADSISDTTILIITADHATYPTPEYQATFNSPAQYFFDEIPFLILIKGVGEKILDAHYKNTLSFTPTVLDILGIDTERNHFLGESLFLDTSDNPYSHISCMEFDCFHIDKSGVKRIKNDEYKDIIDLIHKFYTYSG